MTASFTNGVEFRSLEQIKMKMKRK